MIVWSKVWNWLKHYWWVLLFPIGIIVGIWLVLRGGSDNVREVLEVTKESHKKQKEALEKLNKETKEKKEAVKELHKKAVNELEAKHKKDLKDSKAVTKKEIKKITKEFKDDPSGLAEKFANEFGLDLSGVKGE